MEEKSAFRLMGSLSRRAVLDVNHFAAAYDLDNQLYLYLIRIVEAGTLTANVLAEQVNVEKSTLSRSLKKLEQAGLIKRKQDPKNKKFYVLSATAAGRRKIQPIQQYEEQVIAETTATLSTAEVQELTRILDKMITQQKLRSV